MSVPSKGQKGFTMNELKITNMSTELGAEVTGYVLADVRGVNSMGEYAEDTSMGIELHFAPNTDSVPAVVVCIMPDVVDGNTPVLSIHYRPYDTHKTTEYTAAAREYINSMSEDELIEHGHNEFNGKDQMLAALHTIDLLAAHDEDEARAAYFDFMDNNLSGMSFKFEG